MTAAQDMVFEGPYYPLTISEMVRETHDSCSVILDVPEHLGETFMYRAGQFLTFRVTIGDQRLVRCYSLASSPAVDAVHKVTVKRVAEGRVSNYVNDEWKAGDTLEVMRPAGVFCLRDRSGPIVLFGGGSGITPIISIVKTALAQTDRKLRVLYANRDESSIIFRDELDRLVAANPSRLLVEHSLDDVHGFVDVARASRFVGDAGDADLYICGPGPFMDVAEEAGRRAGASAEQLFIERFELPDVAEAAVEVDAAGGARLTVTLDGATTEITCGEGETILQAVRRTGLEPPFACEEAYCGCCMAMVKEGEVEMKMNDGGIDQGQIDRGWVLTCQGVPKTSSCKIEYPD